MSKRLVIAPSNSLLFLEDINGGTPPEPIWGAKILATPSCISFVCLPDVDGPTEIEIGPFDEIKPGPHLMFEGDLETPSRTVAVTAVDLERVLRVDVAHQITKVRIWYSHLKWPDKVTISVD